MTVVSEQGLGDLAVLSLVRDDYAPELLQDLPDAFASGELTVHVLLRRLPEGAGRLASQGIPDGVTDPMTCAGLDTR